LRRKPSRQRSRERILSSSFDRSSILDSVNAVETVSATGSGIVCDSPLCSVRFDQTGMAISPKRFCCDECKMDAWIIKRAAKLLEGLTDERALKILRGGR